MTNKEIAAYFNELAKIMELHEENPFKVRSYANAYLTLRKYPESLEEMPEDEILKIKGVGKAIASKVREIVETGKLQTLEKYRNVTPEGIRELLFVKGLGPKKLKVVWKELGVESAGELLYACNENRLVELKGFGSKTQEDLREKLEYFFKSKGKFLYATLEPFALQLIEQIESLLPGKMVQLTGSFRRRMPTVEQIEIITGVEAQGDKLREGLEWEQVTATGNTLQGIVKEGIPVCIRFYPELEFGSKQFRHTGGTSFLQAFTKRFPGVDFKGLPSEHAVFERAGISFIPPELREADTWLKASSPVLIEEGEIRGVVHAHTTYSDGVNSLREMAVHARSQGYGYLALSDHSRSAFYANGLQPERVLEQWREIDALNDELAPFRIFKGIESDILADGSLDYEEDLLAGFEFIIASVHSNLKMNEAKATRRLIKAIENPHTTILGHPTGRLLLSRPGYPLDHRAVIDACAANGVAMELNANPYRLDLDWRWIPYALEKGVRISINPDAHSTAGMHDIHYGVLVARKGGLTAEGCLNALGAEGFGNFLLTKH